MLKLSDGKKSGTLQNRRRSTMLFKCSLKKREYELHHGILATGLDIRAFRAPCFYWYKIRQFGGFLPWLHGTYRAPLPAVQNRTPMAQTFEWGALKVQQAPQTSIDTLTMVKFSNFVCLFWINFKIELSVQVQRKIWNRVKSISLRIFYISRGLNLNTSSVTLSL